MHVIVITYNNNYQRYYLGVYKYYYACPLVIHVHVPYYPPLIVTIVGVVQVQIKQTERHNYLFMCVCVCDTECVA